MDFIGLVWHSEETIEYVGLVKRPKTPLITARQGGIYVQWWTIQAYSKLVINLVHKQVNLPVDAVLRD